METENAMQLTRRGFQAGAGAVMTGGTQFAATEMGKLTGAAGRREFLKGAAMIGAAVAAKCGMAMQPGEQKAWDKYNAMKIPRPEGLLEGEPVLQVPAPDSMGVAFAVTALANGFAELADNPGMEKSVRFMAEGMPLAGIDDRVLRVRMTGLRPGTRYWYRVGAAKLEHPVGYWTKPSETVWGSVHSFVTPGVSAPSHFAMMCPNSLMNTKDDLVRNYLVPPENDGYAADTPIVLNRGNHDFRGVAANRLGEVMMTRLPSERKTRDAALDRNFAFRMGDVALIGLDTGEDKPDCHPANGGFSRFTQYRRAQTEWLKDQFLRPEIAKAPYVVAFVHIPIVELWPGANPGTILEDYATWQKECADMWGPVLTANGVQLVLAGHIHSYRHDAATSERSWAEITGGGRGGGTYQTLVECKVEGGELLVRVHNVDKGEIAGEHRFKPRAVGA